MIGTQLSGRFRLEAKCGAGGMSTVYKAFDETLERWVAIKMLHADMSDDESQLERFRREARHAAKLSHPHVVTVIDFGEDEGRPYIVFEFVEGETLKERIRRLGRLEIPEAVAYAIEIGRALQAAHSERIVHRDVKPQNVLIDPDGRAKVTDFGIARNLELDGLTAAGRVLGTTDYVSPEQAIGEDVDGQSDVYSLGVCLYEMLTGDVPFKGENQVAVAMKHVRDPIPDVQHHRPEVSSLLAAIVERATRKERKNRYPTVEEMLHDLEEALAIEAARSGHVTGEATTVLRQLPGDTAGFAPLRLRNPRRVVALLALLGAALAVVIAIAASRTETGGTGSAAPAAKGGGLGSVRLANAEDYDPEGDEREHPESARLAIDDNPSTEWRTEQYRGGTFPSDKRGVGIYVTPRRAVAARELALITENPGFEAAVYGVATSEVPDGIDGWTRLTGERSVEETDRLQLDTAGKEFRHYLLWITDLPGPRVGIQELTLRAERR